MENKIEIFKNEEFGQVRTVLKDNEVWFVGKDVADILDYKESHKAIVRLVDEDDKLKHPVTDSLGRLQDTWLINESGLLSLVTSSRTCPINKKDKFLKWLTDNKLIENQMFLVPKKEIEFFDKLTEVLKPLNIKIKTQKLCLNYRIDGYIEKLKLAIEYDENDHKNYREESQGIRQEIIENELGCTFVRLSDSKSDEYNIGVVIKEILKLN